MSAYNLRSKKKKVLPCYQQEREGSLPPQFNPVVVLKKRVPDIDSNTHRFYVTDDNRLIIKKTVDDSWKGFVFKVFLTCFCLIISVSSLYYFRVDIQDYLKSKAFTVTSMDTYNINKTSVTSEIRDLVLSALDKPREKKKKRRGERAMSFIQEQCLRSEDGPKLEESVIDVFDREHLTDYALETKGARIVTTFDTKPYGFVSLKFWGFEFGSALSYFYERYFYSKAPNKILTPWRKPGDCWAFEGSYGRVKIELWDQVRISAITIDHVRNENFSAEDISSAPKTVSVAARENEYSDRIFLGTFQYKITGPSVQTFPISIKLMRNPCRFVEITITSNHGNENYTCLYRVRVHGRK